MNCTSKCDLLNIIYSENLNGKDSMCTDGSIGLTKGFETVLRLIDINDPPKQFETWTIYLGAGGMSL